MTLALSRDTDAVRLNALVNDPEVYPLVHGETEGPLDLGPMLNNPQNIALMSDNGGWLFLACQFGLYEAHPIFRPSSQDIWALPISQEALRFVFTKTEAVEIFVRVPSSNLSTKALISVLGFSEEFVVPYGWSNGTENLSAEVMSLQIQDWIRVSTGLDETAQELHNAFDREFVRSGITSYAPPKGEITNRYIGAAAEMIFGGQPVKGAVFYNRFAAMSGLAPVAVSCLEPITLLMAGAAFEFHGRNIFLVSPGSNAVN